MFCLEIRKRGESQEENQKRIQEKRTTRNGQEKTDNEEANLRGSAECPIIIDSD